MKLLFLVTTDWGAEFLRLIRPVIPPDSRVIGLSPPSTPTEALSGFVDVSSLAEDLGLNWSYVEDYNLKQSESVETILRVKADLLVVAGWQRLVPQRILDSFTLGCLGFHGGPAGIEKSRGRSPANWALILGASTFVLAMFRLGAGPDDGPVLDEHEITVHSGDDISTIYKKIAISGASMLQSFLSTVESSPDPRPQVGPPQYFPKRLPEDGIVDWSLEPEEIARWSRALTRPYPGLFATSNVRRIAVKIWKSQVLNEREDHAAPPGTIRYLFRDGSFAVQCGSGSLIVTDFSASGSWLPSEGEVLGGQPMEKTFAQICARHLESNQPLPLSALLRNYLAEQKPGAVLDSIYFSNNQA